MRIPKKKAKASADGSAAADPAREEKLKRYEQGYRRLWPLIVTDNPSEYVRASVERFAMSLLVGLADAGHLAKDVAQDAFVQLFEAWFVEDPPLAFPATDQEFDAIVFTAIRYVAANRRRKEGKLKEVLQRLLIKNPKKIKSWIFGPDSSASLEDIVEEAAELLPPKTRDVFVMKWRDGASYEAIALARGLSLKTVDWHLQEANKLLRKRLADYRPARGTTWTDAIDRLEQALDGPSTGDTDSDE